MPTIQILILPLFNLLCDDRLVLLPLLLQLPLEQLFKSLCLVLYGSVIQVDYLFGWFWLGEVDQRDVVSEDGFGNA